MMSSSIVLLYLEGMQRESMGFGSPTSTFIRNALPSARRSAFGHDDELDSNVQDGRKTELSITAQSAMVSIDSI
jgi:hypothetical protein